MCSSKGCCSTGKVRHRPPTGACRGVVQHKAADLSGHHGLCSLQASHSCHCGGWRAKVLQSIAGSPDGHQRGSVYGAFHDSLLHKEGSLLGIDLPLVGRTCKGLQPLIPAYIHGCRTSCRVVAGLLTSQKAAIAPSEYELIMTPGLAGTF